MPTSAKIGFFKTGLQNAEAVTPYVQYNVSANVAQVGNTITYTVTGDYPSSIPIYWDLTSVNGNVITGNYFTGNTAVSGSFNLTGSPINIVKTTVPYNAFDETLILNLRPGAAIADVKANVVGGVTQKANIALAVTMPYANTVTFTVTTNMANGTPLYWDLVGNANVGDFTDSFGLGNTITVAGNTAIVTKVLKVLGNKDVTKTFYADFRSTSAMTAFDTKSSNINIVAANTIVATGGTITSNVDLYYTTHAFSSNSTFNVTFASANTTFDGNVNNVQYLIVGGGGAGGMSDILGVANSCSSNIDLNVRTYSPYNQWNFIANAYRNKYWGAGGGGGGGMLSGNTTISNVAYPVAVGRGGVFPGYPADNSALSKTANIWNQINRIDVDGANSSIFGLTAIGGGHGGSSSELNQSENGSLPVSSEDQLKLFGGGNVSGFGSLPRVAGSGGGAGTWYGSSDRQFGGGAGTAGQGFAGGGDYGNAVVLAGSGGGGAGQAGFGPTANANVLGQPKYIGGNGGNGAVSNITGTSITYAGGGAGASDRLLPAPVTGNYGGIGGLGGGGNVGVAGTNGLGAGGGAGASGGTGTVIVKYLSNARRFSM